ncbi:MAG: SPFH domain-containing protein, partial [Candidatus Absconditabacteria bacterium]
METERNYFIVSIKNHSVTAYPLNFLILFIVVIALFSSFYTVEKNENAVITTLGKYEKTVGPGVHGKIPFIQKSDCIDVTSIRREEFGFRTSQEGSQDQGAIYTDVIEESSMLTGDDTIAVIDYVVQYQVQDPVKWLFNAQQPELIIRNLSMSSTRLVIGYSNFDDVATSGKEKIQLDI